LEKFLIINPFGVGDVIFTTPVISALKENFPDSSIYYWCNDRVHGIFKHDTNIAGVFPFSRGDIKKIMEDSFLEGIKKYWWLFNSIRKAKIDVAFDYSLDYRYSLISFFCGIKKRIGFDYRNRGRFLTDKIPLQGYSGRHMVEYYLELLRFIEANPGNKSLYLSVPQNNRERAKHILKAFGVREGELVVGITPGAGASWGKDAKLKHWPPLKYAELADRIIRELGAKVLVLGDESEKDITDTMTSAMNSAVIDMTGKTTLLELMAFIGSVNLLVTNDGGPLHIASALGVKTVSIFGPVDEKVYGPYPPSALHKVIKHDIGCRPCYSNFRLPPCDKDKECLNSISADEVFTAVRQLLN